MRKLEQIINRRHIFCKLVTKVFISFIFIIIIFSNTIMAKTLTNKDINLLKRKYNKKKNYSRKKKMPTIPPAPGVPPVPGSKSSKKIQRIKGAIIVKKFLPYKEWEKEYKEYFQEHYNDPSLNLHPRMIVLHYSKTNNFAKIWWTFVKGYLYEGKKGHLSVHYVIDKDGTIYQLVPTNKKARGTYGVNHLAISIDLVGINEKKILRNKKQMRVSFNLVKWLKRKYKIPKEKILSHDEIALGKELVPEYTDFKDKKFPNRYPPNTKTRGPGKVYMFKLRYFLIEPR